MKGRKEVTDAKRKLEIIEGCTDAEHDLSSTEEARQMVEHQFDHCMARNEDLIWELEALHQRIIGLTGGVGTSPVTGEASMVAARTSRGMQTKDLGVFDVRSAPSGGINAETQMEDIDGEGMELLRGAPGSLVEDVPRGWRRGVHGGGQGNSFSRQGCIWW